jgi:hypothetical protein
MSVKSIWRNWKKLWAWKFDLVCGGLAKDAHHERIDCLISVWMLRFRLVGLLWVYVFHTLDPGILLSITIHLNNPIFVTGWLKHFPRNKINSNKYHFHRNQTVSMTIQTCYLTTKISRQVKNGLNHWYYHIHSIRIGRPQRRLKLQS